MRCPKCGKPRFMVVDTRQLEEDHGIKVVRERRCKLCGHREEWHDRRVAVLIPITPK